MYYSNSRFPHSSLLLVVPLALASCSGGGDNTSNATSDVSIRFSDAPVDSASKVVITVDKITFRRGGEDIVVDEFPVDKPSSEEPGSEQVGVETSPTAPTFTIDLMQFQKEESKLVLDSVKLLVGEYSDLRISVVDEDVKKSYVEETPVGEFAVGETPQGERKPIKVPSGELKLGKFTVGDNATQSFVIEFGLRQAMTYNPGPDRYILKPRGVRIVRLEQAASVVGFVASDVCDAPPTDTAKNVVYLYEGTDISEFGDAYDPANAAGTAASEPLATATVDTDNNYFLSYIVPGDYTLALGCDVEADDPDTLDGIVINEMVEFTIAENQKLRCDFQTEAENVCVVEATETETETETL